MSELRVGQAAEILGVSADTVRRLIDAGKLAGRPGRGRPRRIDGRALAAWMARRGAGPAAGTPLSARNRFAGLVTRVRKGAVAAQVEIQAGPHRFVSLLTREAVEELGLEPAVLAVASVKATNVLVELAPPRRGRRGAR